MANENVSDSIEQFFRHFARQLGKIGDVHDRLFQKILTVTYLSALARGRYPEIFSDRDRFIKLILEHSNWSDATRISVPQLKLQIERRARSAENFQLSEQFKAAFLKHNLECEHAIQGSEIRRSDNDPKINDFVGAIECSSDEAKLLRMCRHVDLLYDFRSSLVHEFREPGYPMEISDDGLSPYYVSMSDPSFDSATLELTYPRDFLLNLARGTMQRLQAHFSEKGIDPYSSYSFGSAWNQR